MKLLCINGNTSQSITDLIVREARHAARGDTEILGVTARFGARYIASRASFAIAAHAVLDAYADRGANVDGVLIACFGDPGLMALRELATVPVLGMAEASCRLAARRHGRFSIVTGGAAWPAMLREFVATLGLSDRLASIRAVQATGAQIAEDQAGARASLVDACRAAAVEDGAGAVILGGAGLAGIAPRIARDVPVPLVDGLVASIKAAEEAVAAQRASGRPAVTQAHAAVESVGLAPRLSAMLGRG